MRVDWGLFQTLLVVLNYREIGELCCDLHMCSTLLCCKVDFVVISCYFNVNMCMAWDSNDDQQISNTLSLRLLEEICSASLIALIGTCACWAWYACIGWKSIQALLCISLKALCTLQQFASLHYNLWLCGTTWCDVTWCDMMWHDVTWCDMMWHDVRWCDIMWHDLTWCVMFESLWWSWKLIRCQRMRLHPKHEDKPCASTEDFSKRCWLYWIIKRLESFVATCTCVLHSCVAR